MHLTVYLPTPASKLLEAEQLADEHALVPSGTQSANAWVSRVAVSALLAQNTIARLVLTIIGEAGRPLSEEEISAAVLERQGPRRRLTPDRARLVVHTALRGLASTARTWDALVELVADKDGRPVYRTVATTD